MEKSRLFTALYLRNAPRPGGGWWSVGAKNDSLASLPALVVQVHGPPGSFKGQGHGKFKENTICTKKLKEG